jgi:hypothetical protein
MKIKKNLKEPCRSCDQQNKCSCNLQGQSCDDWGFIGIEKMSIIDKVKEVGNA